MRTGHLYSTIFKFKFEQIVGDIGKQENGNFIHIFGKIIAQNFENTPYFEFGKGLLFRPKFDLGKSLELLHIMNYFNFRMAWNAHN